MSHEQLLSRNVIEFSDLVYQFHELNSAYDNQFTLYLDMNGWELFDMRVSRPIIRHEFKHFRQFTSDMRRLYNDILNVSMANISCNRDLKPKPNHIWSVKYIIKKYSIDDSYFIGQKLKKYLQYGKF